MTTSIWRVMFLAEKYGRMTMTLDEVAEQIGMAPGTILNGRSEGHFRWLRTGARTLVADVADVAEFQERQIEAQLLREADRPAREAARRAKARARPTRRSIEKLQMPPWADARAIAEFYATAAQRSDTTGIPHSVDHVIPLRGEFVSGLHVASNLQVLTAVENSRKHNRYEVE